MIAYIPARGGSKRIPRKNIRPLDGRPILAHVIEVLLATASIDTVFVSTDDDEIAQVAVSTGASWLGHREAELANDKAGFSDLIRGDLQRHTAAANDDEVLFVLPTAALLRSQILEQAIIEWRVKRPDILMSVISYSKSPYWALIPKDDGFLQPLFPEMVRINSQDLPPAYTDAGLFYVFSVENMALYDNHKDVPRLQPFAVPSDIAIDIDTEDDWATLETLYATRELRAQGLD